MLSNAYFQDICGNLLGEGGCQMSNFLTNAVRARYSRVNHDVPLKDYMWHVLDVHVVLVWNIHCLEHVKYWIWKVRSHCKARGALSHSGLGALSPLDFWLRLLLWSRCGFLLRGAEHQPDRVLQLLQWRLLILLLFYVTPLLWWAGDCPRVPLETAPCISRLMSCWVTTGQVPYNPKLHVYVYPTVGVCVSGYYGEDSV